MESYYFWDENEDLVGPWNSEEVTLVELAQYGEWLENGPFISPMLPCQ